jgi:hypothetical protein
VIPTIRIHGVPEALRAFDQLPRRVRFKHLRIALNAGGGVIRDAYKARAHRETGLLSKSIGVKVTIPDASFNSKHRGKPATAVVGVKRKAGRMMRLNKKNALKGFGLAQRELVTERKRLTKEGKLSPLKRERAAVKAVLDKNKEADYRNPARYAHLAGPGRKGAEVLASAVRQAKSQVGVRITEKLKQGIEQETRALAAGA